MDNLTLEFAGTFQVSHTPNTTAAPHPRYSQYKSKGSNFLQNDRRQRLLEIQKQQRFDAVAHARRLADDHWKGMEKNGDEGAVEMEASDADVKKPGRYYKNQLMMSEWLVEVPEDFLEEWLMVPCPVGKRTLVVASHGKTVAYNKVGYRINTFPSDLPGGSRQSKKHNYYTILDCLFDEVTGTYWILDLMCWKSMPIYETETEFRFYWLHQNLQEMPHLSVKRRQNPYCFQALPCFPCTPQATEEALANSSFEIDGLLFFHKRTHYTFGSTPLVVWLKPYMVQDVLNIAVPETYMSQMPHTYIDYAHHIAAVKADKHGNEHRREKKNKKSTPDGKKANNIISEKTEENGQMFNQELEMDVNQINQSEVRSCPVGVTMETSISSEAVSQCEAQIKLLIQPTKFKLGQLKLIEPVTTVLDKTNTDGQLDSVTNSNVEISPQHSIKDEMFSIEDSMTLEPSTGNDSASIETKPVGQ